MQVGKLYQHFEFFKLSQNLKPAPCFFLYGTEYFLKDKILNILLKKFSDKDSEQFDTVKFYAEETNAANIIEQLEMNSFLSDFKLVIVKNYDKLTSKDKAAIAQYLKNPVETSILILDSDKLDKRVSSYKIILQNSISIQCRSPYGVQDILCVTSKTVNA